MYDPFRLQLLTLSLDSQVVLVVVGVVLAGLAARVAARSQGLHAAGMPGLVLDGALCALLGARLGWIALHLEYYLRLPTQVLAFGDGGYLFAGGALALGAFVCWLPRHAGLSSRAIAAVGAPAVATALLLDRAGCALTACGFGQPTGLPWALERSGQALQPVALYGVLVWLLALLVLGLIRGRPALAWPLLLGALAVERGLAWWLGHDWADGLVAALGLLGLVLLSRLVRARTPYEAAVSSEGVGLSRG